jgi:hypothetical protein
MHFEGPVIQERTLWRMPNLATHLPAGVIPGTAESSKASRARATLTGPIDDHDKSDRETTKLRFASSGRCFSCTSNERPGSTASPPVGPPWVRCVASWRGCWLPHSGYALAWAAALGFASVGSVVRSEPVLADESRSRPTTASSSDARGRWPEWASSISIRRAQGSSESGVELLCDICPHYAGLRQSSDPLA